VNLGAGEVEKSDGQQDRAPDRRHRYPRVRFAERGAGPSSAWARSGIGLDTGDGGIGLDPRASRGGNIPSVFNVGHWMRDERLTFQTNRVRISPAPYDTYQGNCNIAADTGTYDVIVAGSGLSGLAAAF
jgi:hypothetical protein